MPNTMKPASPRFYAIVLAIIAFTFQACQKSDLSEETTTTAPADVAELQKFVASSMGINEDKVTFNSSSNEFQIDGDGKMTIQQARAHYKNQSENIPMGASGMAQRKSFYSVSSSRVGALKIYVDGTVPAVWSPAIDAAIANWNNAGSRVYITRVYTPTTTTTTTTQSKSGRKTLTSTTSTTTNYDMIVTTNYEASNTIATAYYPNTDGTPGKTITINTYHNGLADSYKIFAFTHEVGHAVGFTHTNGTYGTLVSGTPELDPNSVMNSVCLSWVGFTPYDLTAFRTVYPK